MPFAMSPSVIVVEKDYTDIIPAVSSSVGATVGVFKWGPVLDPLLIDSETTLISRFGLPNDENFQYFFTAANFLAYTDSLYVTRAATAGQRNAISMATGGLELNGSITGGIEFTSAPTITFGDPQISGDAATAVATVSGVISEISIDNGGSGYLVAPTITIDAPGGVSPVVATATATVVGGVITAITVTNRGNGYQTVPNVTITPVSGGINGAATAVKIDTITGVTITNTDGIYTEPPTVTIGGPGTDAFIPLKISPNNTLVINNRQNYIDQYAHGAANVGTWAAKYPGTLGNSITVSMADSTLYSSWAYKDEFDGSPGTSTYATNHNSANSNDELHIIVLDKEGKWTGVKNGILEKFAYVSKASDAKRSDGTINYYKDVINNGSKYVWWMDHPTTITATGVVPWGTDTIDITTAAPKFADLSIVDATEYLAYGVDDFEPDEGDIIDAFSIYNDAEEYDISLIPVGPSPLTVAQYVIQNIAEIRKDCVAFISPLNINTGEPIIGNTAENFEAIVDYRGSPDNSGNIVGLNVSSSYGVLDSGYKYQYDRYSDKYRWVPLNGDIAGLCARTDWTNDPWWSPGGYNRGQIKGVIKLAVNPRKAFRDLLYKNGINPVVTFPGQGTVLFGDKTLLAKPSAFDRINVRRLFIVLEKAIATAAKYQLFEFNDDFTRRKFVSMVEPFLRDVKGRRGLIDFLVKCDTQNNTPEIIDRNEFVADIYLKPARSISFIYLNFIATRTGVDFEEIGA